MFAIYLVPSHPVRIRMTSIWTVAPNKQVAVVHMRKNDREPTHVPSDFFVIATKPNGDNKRQTDLLLMMTTTTTT